MGYGVGCFFSVSRPPDTYSTMHVEMSNGMRTV
jgi:hypothetical protein